MILSEYVEMPLSKRTYKKLVNMYNLDKSYKIGDVAKIPISQLSKSSHYEINVSCDYCNKELKVPYKRYNLSTKIVSKYSCSDKECSNQKIKDVCQAKYGVDNPFQAEFVKEKSKETIKEKWGVEHQMHVDEIKDKIKETSLERYGVDNYTKTKEYLEKTKKTNLERYGVEYSLQSKEIREKGKKTNLERWGVEYSQQSKQVREKTKRTNLERWGVECNLQLEECKEKIKETSLERYGVDNPSKNSKVKEKIKETCLEKYGVNSYTKTDEYLEKTKKTSLEKWGNKVINNSELFRKSYYKLANHKNYLKYIGDNISLFKCDCDENHEFEISTSDYYNRIRQNISLCVICNPIGDSQSIKEKELFNFIDSIYNGEIIQSYRDGLEIDVYLPDLNLGFEFNGLYWHSDKFLKKDYHLKKTKHFKEKGIRIIHIWEDDFVLKSEIMKSQIKNWIGLTENKIFARKCEVKEIKDSKIATKFLEENHIQGKVGSSLKLGLYYLNDLVGLMTFDHLEGRNKMNSNEWNINRFCNKRGVSIVGGASKLFKYFIKNYEARRVISYSDKDWSLGGLYEKLGFTKINESDPDYKYIYEGKRVHKSRFRKSRLNTNLSESKYMKKSQIYKIWDCGKIKWEFYL